MTFASPVRLLLVVAVLAPAAALAHPGHDITMSLTQGLLHPLTGIDHLLAMFATGLWAAQLGRRASWTLPVVFPLAMLLGAALQAAGVVLPAIESMIAVSVIALGAAIAMRVRMKLFAGAALIAVFALFHGYAHALEAALSDRSMYAAGFVLATVSLHLIGLAVGARIHDASARSLPLAGSMIGATGAVLLLAL